MTNPSSTSAEAESLEARGSLGFFEYMGDTDAVDYVEHPENHNASKLSGKTNIGADGDATALANFEQALEYIDLYNKQRTAWGLNENKLCLTLMAISEAQTNWSSHQIAHSQAYNVSEVLAWGTPKDPVANWTSEKKEFDLATQDLYGTTVEPKDAEAFYNAHATEMNNWLATYDQSHPNANTSYGHYLFVASATDKAVGAASNTNSDIALGSFTITNTQGMVGGSIANDYWSHKYVSTQYTTAEIRTKLSEYKAHIQQLKDDAAAQYAALQKAYEEAQNAYNAAEEKVTAAQADADAADQILETAKELAQAKTDLEAAQKDVEEKAAALEQAETAVTDAQQKYDDAVQSVSDLEKKIEDLKNGANPYEEELTKAKQAAVEADQKLNDAKTALQNAEADVTAKQSELDAVTSALEEAQNKEQSAKQKSEDAQAALSAAAEKLQNAQDLLDTYNALEKEVEGAKSALDQAGKDLADKTTAAETAQKDLDEAKANLENAEKEAAEAQKDLDQKTAERDALVAEDQAKIAELTEAVNTAKAALETAQSEYESAEQAAADAKTAYEDLRKEIEDAENRIAEIKALLANGDAELKEAEEKTAKALAEKEAADQALEDAKKALADAQTDLETKTAAYEEAVKAQKDAEAALAAAKEDAEKKHTELEDAKAKLAAVTAAEEKLNAAKAALDAADQKVSEAEQNLSAAQQALKDAEDVLAQVQDKSDRAHALVYKGVDTEEITDPDFEYLNQYIQDLRDAKALADLAQSVYDKAVSDQQAAQKACNEAETELDAAKETLVNAYWNYYHIVRPVNYMVLKGTDGEHVRGSNAGLEFEINADLGKYECLLIDDEAVSPDKYTVRAGSTIVDFSPEFLETYANGTHTVTVLFNDGISVNHFKITEKATKPAEKAEDDNSPKTGAGDFTGYYTSFSMAAIALALLIQSKRKEEND